MLSTLEKITINLSNILESLQLKILQLVLGSLYHFYENIFSETLSTTRRFSGNFKISGQKIVHFLF